MKRLRIGLLFDDTLDRPDGVQQYIGVLGDYLRRRGHKVVYIVGESRPQEGLEIISLAKNISVSGNQNRLSLPLPAAGKRINRALQHDFDVIHVQMPYNPLLSGRLIKRLPETTALVGTFHIVADKLFERLGSRLLALVQRQGLRRFNEIVSVSDAAAEYARQYFGVESRVIPNAVDIKRFERAKPSAGLRKRKWTLTFLGRLVERKGAQYLIEALRILKEDYQRHDFMLHLCGDGPLRTNIEEQVAVAKLRDNVAMHGFVSEDEKAGFLASADFSVFPSTGGESFGIVLVEAMAAGPGIVLAGDNAGYAGVMDSRQEMLFTPQSPGQLAAMMDKYMADKKRFDKVAAWQRQRASQFAIGTVGPRIEELYRSSIKRQLAQISKSSHNLNS